MKRLNTIGYIAIYDSLCTYSCMRLWEHTIGQMFISPSCRKACIHCHLQTQSVSWILCLDIKLLHLTKSCVEASMGLSRYPWSGNQLITWDLHPLETYSMRYTVCDIQCVLKSCRWFSVTRHGQTCLSAASHKCCYGPRILNQLARICGWSFQSLPRDCWRHNYMTAFQHRVCLYLKHRVYYLKCANSRSTRSGHKLLTPVIQGKLVGDLAVCANRES